MNKHEIVIAIHKAFDGIQRYLEIMELFPTVDVSGNSDFQRKFNRFYRVRQRPVQWYQTYYAFMEQAKTQKPTFEDALDHFHSTLNRCEASFTSKLIATVDPIQPVWDKYVLLNAEIPPPKYTSKNKIEQSKAAYSQLQQWYQKILVTVTGQLIVETFNEMVDNFELITDLKKVDFVLWQRRE